MQIISLFVFDLVKELYTICKYIHSHSSQYVGASCRHSYTERHGGLTTENSIHYIQILGLENISRLPFDNMKSRLQFYNMKGRLGV